MASIRSALESLAARDLHEEADFLWFVLFDIDLDCGMPVMVWPAARDGEHEDGWAHEFELSNAVPKSAEFPPNALTGDEDDERFRDAVLDFLAARWGEISNPKRRLAYFSLDEDEAYFSLDDLERVAPWELGEEITARLGEEQRDWEDEI